MFLAPPPNGQGQQPWKRGQGVSRGAGAGLGGVMKFFDEFLKAAGGQFPWVGRDVVEGLNKWTTWCGSGEPCVVAVFPSQTSGS